MEEKVKIEIENYDKQLKELVGQSFSKINYYEIDYGKPSWDEIEFHSIDYGLQIITSNAKEYYFIWDSQYFMHDLKFKKGDINLEFSTKEGIAVHNVTDNVKWRDLIDIKISDIKSNWSYITYSEDNKKCYYPQDVIIEFTNGRSVFISVLEISENKLLAIQDNLIIIFEETILEKYAIVN